MKPVELMIFDLDGTLVTSGNDIASAVNHMLTSLGESTLPESEIMSFVGDGVEKLVARSLGDALSRRFDEALTIFSAYYADHMLDATKLYPGVLEVLEYFRHKHKVIITNKRIQLTRRITDSLKITPYFEEIIGADSRAYNKPDGRLLPPLMDKFCAKHTETVVIGDGVNDILLAKNTGAISCALLGGLSPKGKLQELNPDFLCNDIGETKDLFQ